MRIIRYLDHEGRLHYAAREGPDSARRIAGDIYGEFEVTRETARIKKLLAPVAPPVILGTGLNYRRHAAETRMPAPEHPVVFIKTANAVQNPGDPIVLPRFLKSDKVDYECELAVVLKKPCKNVAREDALECVLGYTCSNDVTARDWQAAKLGGGQWCRSKMFDTFAPLGPCLVTPDEIPDPQALRIRTRVNGEVMQDWSTSDMIFDVPALIAFMSGSTTLPAGAVILTGTPHGVGMARKPPRWLGPGDVVTVEIEGIGELTNPVVSEEV
jgi:2-keto-4-pentenoate hydratase/2-oxohepta-3-ene-1,7-dioic acid hydratase in catechol pathway